MNDYEDCDGTSRNITSLRLAGDSKKHTYDSGADRFLSRLTEAPRAEEHYIPTEMLHWYGLGSSQSHRR